MAGVACCALTRPRIAIGFGRRRNNPAGAAAGCSCDLNQTLAAAAQAEHLRLSAGFLRWLPEKQATA